MSLSRLNVARLGDDRRLQVALASLCIAYGAANAWMHRFIVDDAFISLRYASNFVNGYGLTWNADGEHVEGYTNFLWVLLQSVPLSFGWDSIFCCHLLGLACLVSTLYLTLKLALRVFESWTLSLLVLALVGTNPTLTRFATSGLETPLQALLFVSVLYVTAASFSVKPRWTLARLLGLSLLAALALLTRLDSALLLAIVYPIVLWQIVTAPGSGKARGAMLAAGLIPAAAIVGAWFAWKYSYYGDVLPNAFHARVLAIRSGLVYVYLFLHAHLPLPARARYLPPLVLVFLPFARKVFKEVEAAVAMAAALVVLWCLYVVWAGGDWMGFRMMAPILPALSIVTIRLADRTTTVVRAGLFVLLLLIPMVHTNPHRWTGNFLGADDVGEVSASVRSPQTALLLHDLLHDDEAIVIATGGAGAIAYYSALKTVDVLGLNDRWVAKHGLLNPEGEAGHRRFSPWRYLVEQHVTLVLCDEAEISWENGSGRTSYEGETLAGVLATGFVPDRKDNPLPVGARMLEIPLDVGRAALAVYLTPNASVERAIRTRGWRVVPIHTNASAASVAGVTR